MELLDLKDCIDSSMLSMFDYIYIVSKHTAY